ncbi:MAG: ABC transporter substrate-binding protein, partial [Pseudomonadota bacterium]
MFALAACSPPPAPEASPSTDQTPSVPTRLRIGLEADLQGFDPLQTRLMGVSTLTVADALFDTLIGLSEDGDVVPRLALSLTPSEDLDRWRAQLRPNVIFHDGTPFDAQAVADHFNRLIDPSNRCACRPFLGPLAKVTVEAPLTVVFELSSPWAALPAVLAEPSVVSLIGSPTAVADAGRDFNRAPVGTGPYRFVSWQRGEEVTLERASDYWNSRELGQRPARIEFRILPDQQGRLAALRAGDVDVIWTLDGASAQRADTLGLRVTRRRGAGARLLV